VYNRLKFKKLLFVLCCLYPGLRILENGTLGLEDKIMAPSEKTLFRHSKCNTYYPSRRKAASGGTIINTITLIIFLGLIGLGVWWIIKSFGQAGQQYTDAMITTQNKALVINCHTNLRSIWQSIQTYAITNEQFPSSQQDLIRWIGDSRVFRCPASDPPVEYVYIPGQNLDMPPDNVLVYEPEPVHDGRCSVLRQGGQIELLTPEQLQAALTRTRQSLR
jgi:hypothetical protein